MLVSEAVWAFFVFLFGVILYGSMSEVQSEP